jgi:hypothetical protein
MEIFNIQVPEKIYLTGFIWNKWQCRAGRAAQEKTSPIGIA